MDMNWEQWKHQRLWQQRLPRVIRKMRRSWSKEALACAIDNLNDWLYKGIDLAHASRGSLYMVLPGTRTLRKVPADYSRFTRNRGASHGADADIDLDADDAPQSSVCYWVLDTRAPLTLRPPKTRLRELREQTRSALAIPISDVHGDVIAVQVLEADRQDALSDIYAKETVYRANTILIDLLVVREFLRDPDTYLWHPEVHGWSPPKLADRFCRMLALCTGSQDPRPPSCSIWNCEFHGDSGFEDPDNWEAWVLGTFAYDSDFRRTFVLRGKSAVATVAYEEYRRHDPRSLQFQYWQSLRQRLHLDDAPAFRQGSPVELNFLAQKRARRTGLHHAAIVGLYDEEHAVCGTFNLYTFGENMALPPLQTLFDTAREARRFLATVNRQRSEFAKAHILAEMSRTPDPSPGRYRRALQTVFVAAHAIAWHPVSGRLHPYGEVVVPASNSDSDTSTVEDGTVTRQTRTPEAGGIATKPEKAAPEAETGWTGSEADQVGHAIEPHDPTSQTAFNFSHPGLPTRDNGGDIREPVDLPPPATRFMPMEDLSRASGNAWRRRMGIGIGDKGVVRVYRSASGRPFTRADAAMLRQIHDTPQCARHPFHNWACKNMAYTVGPTLTCPPSSALARALERQVNEMEKDFKGIRAASVLFYDQAVSSLKLFARYPAPPLPFEEMPDVPSLLKQLVSRKSIAEFEQNGTTWICIPVQVWFFEQLLQALVTFEFDSQTLFLPTVARDTIIAAAADFSASLCWNRWNVGFDREEREQIVHRYKSYVDSMVRNARLFVGEDEEGTEEATGNHPDPELRAIGLKKEADTCLIPLRLGPFRIAHLEMRSSDLCLEASVPFSANHWFPKDPQRPLKRLVAQITGAWMRLVAQNQRIWLISSCADRDQWLDQDPQARAVRLRLWNYSVQISPDWRSALAEFQQLPSNADWQDPAGGEG